MSLVVTLELLSLEPGMVETHEKKEQNDVVGGARNGLKNGPTSLLGNCEFIGCHELARRLDVPVTWVRDQVRSRVEDPLPHVHFGKYVRFLWGSSELEEWVARRIVNGNNRRVERVR
jgi:hypothetical protein